MCLIAIAWRAHPRYQLALIANRDEFHARPTAAAGFDPDVPDVYGGRDLQAGGSWLQVSTRGRLAAVTNVRTGSNAPAPRSRGALVRDFVRGRAAAGAFVDALAPTAGEYGPFNLLAWDGEALVFGSNHPHAAKHAVAPGLHAMSNGAFDAPWPKSGHATRALAAWLATAADPTDTASLFDALSDPAPAPDAALPDTGVGTELERVLSPVFVRGARYGTRCSSIVLVEARTITFMERRHGPDAIPLGETRAALARHRVR